MLTSHDPTHPPCLPLSRSLARSSPDNGTSGYRRSLGYCRHRSKHHALPGAIDLSVDMQWVGPVQREGAIARPVDGGQCVPGFLRWTLHGSRLLRVASSDISSDYIVAYNGSDYIESHSSSGGPRHRAHDWHVDAQHLRRG